MSRNRYAGVVLFVGIAASAFIITGCQDPGASQSTSEASKSVAGSKSEMDAWAKHVPVVGDVETFATFDGPMPTGVTVSQDGRVFVNFPRWGDAVAYTVGEVKNGKTVAFPNAELNHYDAAHVAAHLVSVQSVVVDPANRLWLLDTGSVKFGPTSPGGPKLVGVDLTTNAVFQIITFPTDVALPATYLNDVRFDLRRGGGIAYITDSGDKGPNGIIVVDLASGKSWRRLSGHPSVRPESQFVPTVEGRPFMKREAPGQAAPITLGSDGIAISADGKRLFYTPLAGRHIFSVDTDALADPSKTNADVAATVQDLGARDYASDGLESDAAGNLYLTDYEHNAIHRRDASGHDRIIAQGPKIIWPDTMSIAADGNLYWTANQLDRQKSYNEGKDLREKPYTLFRMKIATKPVLLK